MLDYVGINIWIIFIPIRLIQIYAYQYQLLITIVMRKSFTTLYGLLDLYQIWSVESPRSLPHH